MVNPYFFFRYINTFCFSSPEREREDCVAVEVATRAVCVYFCCNLWCWFVGEETKNKQTSNNNARGWDKKQTRMWTKRKRLAPIVLIHPVTKEDKVIDPHHTFFFLNYSLSPCLGHFSIAMNEEIRRKNWDLFFVICSRIRRQLRHRRQLAGVWWCRRRDSLLRHHRHRRPWIPSIIRCKRGSVLVCWARPKASLTRRTASVWASTKTLSWPIQTIIASRWIESNDVIMIRSRNVVDVTKTA